MSKLHGRLKYMPSTLTQPISVGQYVINHDKESPRKTATFMLARLLTILVAKGIIDAPMLRYIVEGRYDESTVFVDFNPDDEIRREPTIAQSQPKPKKRPKPAPTS